MNDDTDDVIRSLQQRVADLTKQVAANRADIDRLTGRADAANDRADRSEARADAAQDRADKSEARADDAQDRADKSEARADANHLRIDNIESRLDVDEEMIAELQAEGVLRREHAAQMEEALRSSRKIGSAMGVVMANRGVSEEVAFAILAKASSITNRKLRIIANEVVRDLKVSDLPDLSEPV
jgi:chromosome segregation ATPase